MKINILKIIVLGSLCVIASNTHADFYDGRSPLLCSIYQLFECDPPNDCVTVTPDQINGFSHINIDFSKKVLTRAGVESEQKSAIRTVETNIDGKLIIQGIEDGSANIRDGAGWTMSIMNPEGTMVLSSAADGFAVVALGACVPRPLK